MKPCDSSIQDFIHFICWYITKEQGNQYLKKIKMLDEQTQKKQQEKKSLLQPKSYSPDFLTTKKLFPENQSPLSDD